MRLLIALIVFMAGLLSSPAPCRANDPESPADAGNRLYLRCMAGPDPLLNLAQQNEFCSCAGAQKQEQVQKRIDRDAKKSWIENLTRSPDAEQKSEIADVYGPCLYIPGWQRAYNDCYYDSTSYRFLKSRQALDGMCRCVADDLKQYLRNYGPALLAVLIERNENVDDLLEALRQNINYIIEQETAKTRCFQAFTSGPSTP